METKERIVKGFCDLEWKYWRSEITYAQFITLVTKLLNKVKTKGARISATRAVNVTDEVLPTLSAPHKGYQNNELRAVSIKCRKQDEILNAFLEEGNI